MVLSREKLGSLIATQSSQVEALSNTLSTAPNGCGTPTVASRTVAEAERLRAIDVLELRNRLAAFALHCDHETRGAARLRRLTPRDAQYARCRRAAAENARRGFFAGGGPFAGLDVVDVFKIENRCLLDAFQREVERRKTPRSDEKKKAVKGLFCDVPAASVERLVLYGLRGDAAPFRALVDNEIQTRRQCLIC